MEVLELVASNHAGQLSCCGGLGAVALFIFLAGAAGAGIVPANFFLRADDLLHLLRVSGAGHAGLFQFAALAAHEGFF